MWIFMYRLEKGLSRTVLVKKEKKKTYRDPLRTIIYQGSWDSL